MVWLASKVLSDQYQLELLDAEIAFLTIYFEIAVEKLETPDDYHCVSSWFGNVRINH